MYDLGGPLAGTTVPSGTNLLVAGPPLTGKRRLGRQILRRGTADGEGAIVISTRDTATRVQSLFDDDDLVGVVDCVTERVRSSPTETDTVRYASSPTDLTGIGIEFTEFLEYFQSERSIARNRVLFDSVTTLLEYSTLQTVFRFLHAVTARVAEVDALGVFVVESSVHDEKTMATVRELFDGVVETDRDGGLSVDLPDDDRREEPAEF